MIQNKKELWLNESFTLSFSTLKTLQKNISLEKAVGGSVALRKIVRKLLSELSVDDGEGCEGVARNHLAVPWLHKSPPPPNKQCLNLYEGTSFEWEARIRGGGVDS